MDHRWKIQNRPAGTKVWRDVTTLTDLDEDTAVREERLCRSAWAHHWRDPAGQQRGPFDVRRVPVLPVDPDTDVEVHSAQHAAGYVLLTRFDGTPDWYPDDQGNVFATHTEAVQAGLRTVASGPPSDVVVCVLHPLDQLRCNGDRRLGARPGPHRFVGPLPLPRVPGTARGTPAET